MGSQYLGSDKTAVLRAPTSFLSRSQSINTRTDRHGCDTTHFYGYGDGFSERITALCSRLHYCSSEASTIRYPTHSSLTTAAADTLQEDAPLHTSSRTNQLCTSTRASKPGAVRVFPAARRTPCLYCGVSSRNRPPELCAVQSKNHMARFPLPAASRRQSSFHCTTAPGPGDTKTCSHRVRCPDRCLVQQASKTPSHRSVCQEPTCRKCNQRCTRVCWCDRALSRM